MHFNCTIRHCCSGSRISIGDKNKTRKEAEIKLLIKHTIFANIITTVFLCQLSVVISKFCLSFMQVLNHNVNYIKGCSMFQMLRVLGLHGSLAWSNNHIANIDQVVSTSFSPDFIEPWTSSLWLKYEVDCCWWVGATDYVSQATKYLIVSVGQYDSHVKGAI